MLAQVRPGEVFALANVHLRPTRTALRRARRAGRCARSRGSSAGRGCPRSGRRWRASRRCCGRGIPTLMTGDFNTPVAPRLDSRGRRRRPGRALSGARGRSPRRSRATASRTPTGSRIPTPSRRPGITWTFGYPFPRRAADEVIDRIDLIQASAGRRRCSTAASPARRARRTSPFRSIPTRPTTAPSWHACASCRPRRRGSRRSCTGASCAARRSACATPPRAARAPTGWRSCARAAAPAARS